MLAAPHLFDAVETALKLWSGQLFWKKLTTHEGMNPFGSRSTLAASSVRLSGGFIRVRPHS